MVDTVELLLAVGLVGSYVLFVFLRLYLDAVSPADSANRGNGGPSPSQPTPPGGVGDAPGVSDIDGCCDYLVRCESCGAINDCCYTFCWNCVARLPD